MTLMNPNLAQQLAQAASAFQLQRTDHTAGTVSRSEQVVVGSCSLIECLLTAKVCDLRYDKADLADELGQTIPDGYREWAVEHLASVMTKGHDPADGEIPNCVVVAWGRVWERGSSNSMFTKIACFILQAWPGGVSESRCQPCFVVCTPEGAVARYQIPAARKREVRQFYEPHASRLAAAASMALQSVRAHLDQREAAG